MKKLLPYIFMVFGLSLSAQADTLLLTVTGTGGTTEQRLTLTPGTILTVSGSGTVEVLSTEDFKTAIGLGNSAGLDVGTTTGTVAAGDDARFSATVYVGPSGDDGNAGTEAAPLATLDAAIARIGGNGQVLMLSGTYLNEMADLAEARALTIAASDPTSRPQVFLGEKVTAFSSTGSNVWQANVSTVIPIASDRSNGGDAGVWVFEWGTPEGAIAGADRRALQRGKSNRLDHTRLTVADDLADLQAGANGRFWYDSGVLYIKATDGGDPNGADYWIPSQTADQAFVYGVATDSTDIKIQGIDVYFGNNNFDIKTARRYEITDCLAFGAANEGLNAYRTGYGVETRNEYAANANDGSGATNSVFRSQIIIAEIWAHDNGDEGHSIHQLCDATYIGGLYEYNASGGITPAQGATINVIGSKTRGNAIGINFAVSSPPTDGTITGWLSEADNDGLFQWSAGTVVVSDSSIISPIRYGLAAINDGAITHVNNVQIYQSGSGDYSHGGSTATFNFRNGRNANGVGDLSGSLLEVSGTNLNTLTYSGTGGAGVYANTIEIPNAGGTVGLRIESPLTQLDLRYNGSANFDFLSTRSIGLVAGSGYDVFFSPNQTTTWIMRSGKTLDGVLAGARLRLKEGTNAASGVATLVSGTISVATTVAVSGTSRFLLSRQAVNSSTAMGTLSIGTIISGTSFVIQSLDATATVETGDLSDVYWQIVDKL